MKYVDFLRLFRLIFGKPEPDLKQIENLGLLAVKLGQVFALRIDFLGEKRCQTLAGLYERQSKPSGARVEELLSELGGESFLDHFSSFEREPFAVASIGQVHRARLQNGEDVAVKLVKQESQAQFEADIRKAEWIFKVAQWVYPKLRGVANPASILCELRAMTLNELDLRNEVSGHRLLEEIRAKAGAGFGLEKLQFAHLYPEISGPRVLVKEFIDGQSVDALLRQGKLSYQTLLELFHVHGYYMFVEGVFHGDIHPGNVLLKDGQIYFIDTGYIGRVTDRIRLNLFEFFDRLCQQEYGAAAESLYAMSLDPLSPKALVKFERQFLALYDGFSDLPVGQASLTQKMMQTIKLGVLSGMSFEEGMFDIIKSLMYMDGMVLRANPGALLLKDLRPLIADFRGYVR